jgi:hypothetical protein
MSSIFNNQEYTMPASAIAIRPISINDPFDKQMEAMKTFYEGKPSHTYALPISLLHVTKSPVAAVKPTILGSVSGGFDGSQIRLEQIAKNSRLATQAVLDFMNSSVKIVITKLQTTGDVGDFDASLNNIENQTTTQFVNNLHNTIDALRQAGHDFAEKKTEILQAANNTGSFFSNLFGGVGGFLSDLWAKIKQWFSDAVDWVENAVADAAAWVANAVSDVGDFFSDLF